MEFLPGGRAGPSADSKRPGSFGGCVETDLRAYSAGPEIGRPPVTCPGRERIGAAISNFAFARGGDAAGSPRYFTDTFDSKFLIRIKFQPTRPIYHFADLAESTGETAGRFPVLGKTIVST
jgi:hypothetical protein